MKRHRLHPLAATLRRLRAHPYSRREVHELWAALEAMEAEVEQLGAMALQERADVEWIERPLVRAYLWAMGDLAARDARERSEADAAMAATMQRGDQARQLRAWLESLPRDQRRIDDKRVAADLERLEAADLPAYPEYGPELQALWERAHRARDLIVTAGQAKQISTRLGAEGKRHRPARREELQRLASRLRKQGRGDLTLAFSPVPSSVYLVRQALKNVRKDLARHVKVLRKGLARDLADIVRSRVRREVPVLDTLDVSSHPPS